jgi:hypothetical protein
MASGVTTFFMEIPRLLNEILIKESKTFKETRGVICTGTCFIPISANSREIQLEPFSYHNRENLLYYGMRMAPIEFLWSH